jgi:hypothetical protein
MRLTPRARGARHHRRPDAGRVGLTVALLPETDYLPEGRQNFIFGFILPPPGVSVQASREEFTERRQRAHASRTSRARKQPRSRVISSACSATAASWARAPPTARRGRTGEAAQPEILGGFPDTMAFANPRRAVRPARRRALHRREHPEPRHRVAARRGSRRHGHHRAGHARFAHPAGAGRGAGRAGAAPGPRGAPHRRGRLGPADHGAGGARAGRRPVRRRLLRRRAAPRHDPAGHRLGDAGGTCLAADRDARRRDPAARRVHPHRAHRRPGPDPPRGPPPHHHAGGHAAARHGAGHRHRPDPRAVSIR